MAIRNATVKQHQGISLLSPVAAVRNAKVVAHWGGWTRSTYLKIASHRQMRVWLVQSISIARILATILFATLVSMRVSPVALSCVYVFAIVSDFLDGCASRHLKAETHLGKVLDLAADKALTAVSLIYAAGRGVDILPIALIACRDIIMIGMRLVMVEGAQLLPTSRVFGGIMAFLLWGNTVALVNARSGDGVYEVVNGIYWACALSFSVNLLMRLYVSGPRLAAASLIDLFREEGQRNR